LSYEYREELEFWTPFTLVSLEFYVPHNVFSCL